MAGINSQREVPRRKYSSDYYQRNKDKYRWSVIKNKYGITKDDYEELLTKQKFSCAICHIHQSELTQPLYIDHCHSTGKVRGLLCAGCNTGLGQLGDTVESLEKAINYLKGL